MSRRSSSLILIAVALAVLVAGGAFIYFSGEDEEGNQREKNGNVGRISGRTEVVNGGGVKDDPSDLKRKKPVMVSVMEKATSGELGLTEEQVEEYVNANDRDVQCLLVASRIGSVDGKPYLDEAAEKFPDDPHVAFEMVQWSRTWGEEETGIDQDMWIARLQENDPNNAAGYLFGARRALEGGDHEEALANLTKVESTVGADFYTDFLAEGLIEAYQMSGYPGLEGETMGAISVAVPFATEMMKLNKDVSAALGFAVAEGNRELAEKLGRSGMAAASRVSDSNTFVVTRLVGAAMERSILGQLEDLELIPGDSKFVFERKQELDAFQSELKEIAEASGIERADLSDEELGTYLRMMRKDGELAAMKWLAEKRSRE